MLANWPFCSSYIEAERVFTRDGAQNHNIIPCQELKMQKELLTNKRENNHDFSAHTYRIFMSSDSYIPSWYITIIAARLGMVYAI